MADEPLSSEVLDGLTRKLRWLYPDPSRPCRCAHDYVRLGSLQGVNMGKGWVRTGTHPDCYHHGTAEQQGTPDG